MSESKVPNFFKQGVIVLLVLTAIFLIVLAVFNKSEGKPPLDTSSLSGLFGISRDSVPVDSTDIKLDSIYSDSLKVVD